MNWYSVDSKLKTSDHPPVDLKGALEIVDEYHSRGIERFDSAEEAISATMFGFSRSAGEFIEFCVNGLEQISYKFEQADPQASWLRKAFGGTFQFESVLRSKAEMIERVEEFFTLTPAAIKSRLSGGKARPSS